MIRTRAFRLMFLITTVCMISSAYLVFRPASAKERDDWHVGLPKQYGSKWFVHDDNRPKPVKVKPGRSPQDPPSDAIVLFDGKDLSAWKTGRKKPEEIIKDGFFDVNGTGIVETKQQFSDCQLHIEWKNPKDFRGKSQVRGNSGIFFMGRYEIQILDNYDNETYADGYAGSLYGQHPPIANACKPSGEWQVYDIVFRAPRFKDGELVEKARATIFHNGVVVQNDQEFFGSTTWRNLAKYRPHGPGSIRLQDHGDGQSIQFRNIWLRELDLRPSD